MFKELIYVSYERAFKHDTFIILLALYLLII